MLLEQQYAITSLQQHVQASEFVNRFRAAQNGKNDADYEQIEIPNLEEALSALKVDPQCFRAHFINQLSNNEKFLLSTGVDLQNNPSNSPQKDGLPTPSQLQNVFDVLSKSVSPPKKINFPDTILMLHLVVFSCLGYLWSL